MQILFLLFFLIIPGVVAGIIVLSVKASHRKPPATGAKPMLPPESTEPSRLKGTIDPSRDKPVTLPVMMGNGAVESFCQCSRPTDVWVCRSCETENDPADAVCCVCGQRKS